MEEINQLFDRVTELGQTSTEAFQTMREKQHRIKALLAGTLMEIKKLHAVQDRLNDAEKQRNGAVEDVKRYSNFKQTKEVETSKLVDCEYYNTMCQKHAEQYICHEHCGLPQTTTVGHNVFRVTFFELKT